MEVLNTFEGGMRKGSNERSQPEKTIFDSVNGQLYQDSMGNVVWRPINGNARVLVFDTNVPDPDFAPTPIDAGNGNLYTPIGGFSFADCMVVVTVREVAPSDFRTVIWAFQQNNAGDVYGQPLIADNNQPADKRFTQRIWNNIRMRGVFENDQTYRVMWVDGVEDDSNPPRSLSFRVATPGTVTNPVYAGQTVQGTFKVFEKLQGITPDMTNMMSEFKMGVMRFKERTQGQLRNGRYVYCYRLLMEDGYRTPWSHLTSSVFVTSDPIDQDNMHLYEMEGSDEMSPIGNVMTIYGVDQRYKTIEAAYIYIPDNTVIPTVAASFAFVEITGNTHDVLHTSMSGEPQSVEEIIALRMNFRAAQTLEVKDQHLWYGNYKVKNLLISEAELEEALNDLKAVHIFRDMAIDRKGKTDKSNPLDGNPEPLFHCPPETTTSTLWLNQNQEFILPVEDDYPGYRGQQVDNSYVGYPRDEVVRFGILWYDTEGNPAHVDHLFDYRFPKMFLGGTAATDPFAPPTNYPNHSDFKAQATRILRNDNTLNVLDNDALDAHVRSWLTTNGDDPYSFSGTPSAGPLTGEPLERPVLDTDDPGNDVYKFYTTMKQVYARIQGLAVSGIKVSHLVGKIGGYAIVRCPIEYSTLMQGIVSPCCMMDDSQFGASGAGDPDGNNTRIFPWVRPNLGYRQYGSGVNQFGTAPVTQQGAYRPIVFNDIRRLADLPDQGFYFGTDADDSPNVFGVMYFPDLMFGAPQPRYDSNQEFELTQVLWEEYNCGMEINGYRPTVLSGGSKTNWSTHLCNQFLSWNDQILHTPFQGTGTKLSWHLLYNSRYVHHEDVSAFGYNGTPAQMYWWNFHQEGIQYPSDARFLIGDHFREQWYSDLWGNLGQVGQVTPKHGHRFKPDFLLKMNANERRSAVNPNAPAREIFNIAWYLNKAAGPGTYPHDDYYGWTDDDILHGSNRNRQGAGHDNALFFRMNRGMTEIDGSPANVYGFMTVIIPTWAAAQVPHGSGYYVADPQRASASRWMTNWKRELNAPYGGMTQNNLQFNIFIGTGHFQPVGNDEFDAAIGNPTPAVIDRAEIWGGETWLDLHSGVFMYPNYAHNNTTQNSGRWEKGDFGFIMVFPWEGRFNHALRNAISFGDPMSPHAGLRARSMYEGTPQIQSYWQDKGLFFYGGNIGDFEDATKHLLEEFFYNEVLGYHGLRIKGFGTIPRGFRAIRHWPQRWHYSQRKIYGELMDVFREFFPNNYYDLEGIYGAIMASAVYDDKVVSLQELAHGLLRIYERTILPSDSGQLVTGDASAIDGIRYVDLEIGCQHPESVVATKDSLYWVDAFRRAIVMQRGDKTVVLSDELGLNQFLRELLWRYVDSRSIHAAKKGLAIVSGHDERTGRVFFSFPSKVKDAVHGLFNESLRYSRFSPLLTNGPINGVTHRIARITPVDKGSTVAQQSSTGFVHVQEQDIVVLRGQSIGITATPAYLYIDLHQGEFSLGGNSGALTVREFYIAIEGIETTPPAGGWFVEFSNVRQPDLSSSTVVRYPDPASQTEREGWLYYNQNYAEVVPAQAIQVDGKAAVFHLYRTEKEGPFHVRALHGNGSLEDVAAGLQYRHTVVYNETFETFEPFISSGRVFMQSFRDTLYSAVETAVAHGMFVENVRSPEKPVLYGKGFQSHVEVSVNPLSIANKVWDALRLDGASMSDVVSVRYSTEEQAVVLVIATDNLPRYYHRLGRLPIRRANQPFRVRGNYLRIMVEVNGTRNRLAYVHSLRTVYRLTENN